MKEKILELLRQACAVNEPDLNMNSKLKEVSLDSLSFIRLVVNLENEFDVEFDDECLLIDAFESVQGLVDFVEVHIGT